MFVLSYGATDIATNIINDFAVGEDLLGLINLGVTAENFGETITQSLSTDGLSLNVNGSALATLTGVSTELGADSFYLV